MDKKAREVTGSLQRRINRVKNALSNVSVKPRVLCLEWTEPPFYGGHWIPEMVGLAGGIDGLGQPAIPSSQVPWEDIEKYQPEVIVAMPCGFNLDKTVSVMKQTRFPDGWWKLPAVKNGQVYVVDGSSYFSRPGPRIVDGLEILAEILHPEVFARKKSKNAWVKWEVNGNTL